MYLKYRMGKPYFGGMPERCRRAVYGIYKKTQHLPLVATAAHLLYDRFYWMVQPEARPCYDCPVDHEKQLYAKSLTLKDLRIAILCDEMTYRNLLPECSLRFVTPHNWPEVFEQFSPELFFCEAAWSGIERYPNVWRGKIYRSDSIRFENRQVLLNILDYCRRHKIPSVFWNKEDPVYFGNRDYDFIDTALRFDTVLTTAAECIPQYRAAGAQQIGILPFAFSPQIYHPMDSGEKENTAVFAGSWYADQPERCKDMERIFDEVLHHGIELCIYDRHDKSNNPIHLFPEKYRSYLHPAVDYRELGEIYRHARYAININTVTGSQTMFARRVFEIMACNTLVISNESPGMRNLFPDSVWYEGNRLPEEAEEICRFRNLEKVFLHHTFRGELCRVLHEVGYLPKETPPGLLLVYLPPPDGKREEFIRYFEEMDYPAKYAALWQEGTLQPLPGLPFAPLEKCSFFIPFTKEQRINNLPFLLSQFSYLPVDAGIRFGLPGFHFGQAQRLGTIFQTPLFSKVMDRPMEDWEKVLLIPTEDRNDIKKG